MTKVQKRLNVLLTVVMILCVLICMIVCVQVISGREASLFGFRIYHILTGSMEPTIPTGSNVLVRTVDPDTLQEGDIITFISHDSAIYGSANTHRIIRVETDDAGARCFVTRGDANNMEDEIRVYPADVKGKVVFHLSASANLFLGFLHTRLGFVLVIVLPLMLVIWLFMKDFRKEVKQFTYEKAKESLEEATAAASEAEQPAEDESAADPPETAEPEEPEEDE